MFERDYLKRLIEQTAKALGAIMGLREQKKQEEALELIDEHMSRELRMKTRLAMGLSDRDLLNLLSTGGKPQAETVAVIAACLQEEAELLSELGRASESVPRFAKSLRLHLYLMREEGGFDGWDIQERIRRLLESLAPCEWDEETLRAVWLWRESAGEWAEAENLLYELRETAGISAEEGHAFYDRLAARSDEDLEKGGLSRAEVEEGRKEWDRLTKETVG